MTFRTSQRAHRRDRRHEPTHCAEHDALDQQFADNAAAARAERRANGKFLLSPSARTSIRFATLAHAISRTRFRPSPSGPRGGTDVAGFDLLQRPQDRREPRLLEHLGVVCRRSGGKRRSETGTSRARSAVRLRERHARLQPRDARVVELPQTRVAPIEPDRQDHRRLLIEETEIRRQDADDLSRAAIEQNAAAENTPVAAKSCLPVLVWAGPRSRGPPGESSLRLNNLPTAG